MLTFRLTLHRSQKEALKKRLKTARNLGAIRNGEQNTFNPCNSRRDLP